MLHPSKMSFQNEFANYEPLRRIVDSKKLQHLQKRLCVCNKSSATKTDATIKSLLVKKSDLEKSNWQPDMVLAIDGSFHDHKIENGFPGAECGYITIASVLIMLDKVREFGKQTFIDPKKFRETEKAATIESIFPGCNVVVDNDKDTKTSFRKIIFEELKNSKAFDSGETLLDTYEALLKIRLEDSKPSSLNARSPIDDVDDFMTYGYGEFSCPRSKEKLYSTDALRLHERLNKGGSNQQVYNQTMLMLEKLWLVHILRAFEKKGWLPSLRRIVFMLDGPLACFDVWAWLSRPIMQELKRINELQKKTNDQDLLILGIEKSGLFYDHFQDLDTGPSGNRDVFPCQSGLLLNDTYIKQNIIFSKSLKPYGLDTYLGRKFFYKTKNGYQIVPVVAFFGDRQDLKSAEQDQFTRLADVMDLLDDMVSSRYPDSVSPLASAHAEAAIPLNLGKKIFDEISREIRKNS